MRTAALVLFAAVACGGAAEPPPPPFVAPRNPAALAARLPQRQDLICFPCHSQLKFEKGPPFAHAASHHRNAGHCHTCHLGAHHEGREIDKSACLTCHEAGSEDLLILSRRDRSSK